MVKFESKKTFDGLFLTVKDDNDREKTLVIPVFTPAIGPFREAWQDDVTGKPLSTLYHRILQKEVAWPSRIQYGVEFSHIPLYWEWAEDIIRRCKPILSNVDLLDAVYTSLFLYECNPLMMQRFCESWCPSTNTLLTEAGETSISLWDIRTLSGLPITDMLYDKVVPVANELEPKMVDISFHSVTTQYFRSRRMTIHNFASAAMVAFHGPNAIRALTGTDAKASIRSGKDLNWSSFLIPSRGMNIHSLLLLILLLGGSKFMLFLPNLLALQHPWGWVHLVKGKQITLLVKRLARLPPL
ncbi:Elongation factor G [Bienertia sinuspersici]